ncbi:MAG: hypothetical protein QME79_02160 [Bacillota bacterium]|nr:hypothetical protein [Bacillota bacterium]
MVERTEREGPPPVREIETAVRERAKDGRLACREAFALADELGVAPGRIGEAANAIGVKICGCQLGCFK